MIGSEDERVNQDVGTPREGPSDEDVALLLKVIDGGYEVVGDGEMLRLRGIEAAARVLTAYQPTNPTEGQAAALRTLREALDPASLRGDRQVSRTVARPIASTQYAQYVEVECVQMCGWRPERAVSSEAVRHVKATGHETAVKYRSSIHYHVRRDESVASRETAK